MWIFLSHYKFHMIYDSILKQMISLKQHMVLMLICGDMEHISMSVLGGYCAITAEIVDSWPSVSVDPASAELKLQLGMGIKLYLCWAHADWIQSLVFNNIT